jgi:hypothetical protein
MITSIWIQAKLSSSEYYTCSPMASPVKLPSDILVSLYDITDPEQKTVEIKFTCPLCKGEHRQDIAKPI